jgi:exosortase/archaeosortase family protein
MTKLGLIRQWRRIPLKVRLFLRNALLIFASWQLLYALYIYPTRIMDDFLTKTTGMATESILQLIYSAKRFYAVYEVSQNMSDGILSKVGKSLVWMGERPLISIVDSCNGLNMYALFIGFIIAFPSSIILKFGFGSMGLLALIGFNIARCVGLAILQIHYPNFTVFAHHYIFNVLTYAMVFGLWYYFTKKATE